MVQCYAMEWNIDWIIAQRIFLAGLLCGLIGLERSYRNKPAGLRTHLLVGIGSALIMMISIHMATLPGTAPADPTRIASNVVAGLGFLGAGTIMREGASVHGLTTAASLWAAGAVGLAVGCGYYQAAFQGTLAILLALEILGLVEFAYLRRRRHRGQ